MKIINDFKKTLETLGFTLAKQQPKHYKRQDGNPLQISAITDKKIHAMLENTGIVIDPKSKEHREKYFSGIKPIKFLTSLVDTDKADMQLFNFVANNFLEQFTKGIKLNVKLYEAADIPTFYNMLPNQLNDNGKRTYISTGVSCMQGKSKRYFDVYKNTESLKIAILEDEAGNMYGRALLWKDDSQNLHYLDRIYIADTLCGSDDIKKVYQAQMYTSVIKALKIDKMNCYSLSHFSDLLTETEKDAPSHPPRPFTPTLSKEGTEFEYFPYSDTFQGIDGNEWNEDDNGAEVGLTSTDGTNANDESYICDECGDRINEEDASYSDIDNETLCEDCSCFCEDRDECINNNNAVYNNHTGVTHHRDDLGL